MSSEISKNSPVSTDTELRKAGQFIAKLLALPVEQRAGVYVKITEMEEELKDVAESAYLQL